MNNAQDKKGIEASWAGGEAGIEILTGALPYFDKLIHPTKGVFYLLLIQENLSIIGELQKLGFKWSVVMKREVMCEN